MDTPVIDLTAAPDSPRRRNESAASSSSQEAPLVATSLTAARTAHSQDGRTVNAVAGGSGPSTRLPVLPARRRVPYPTNAASTPIDLTDDDIEYLGEHRLHLPDQPHVEGNDARPVAGDNYSLMDRLRNAAGMPFSRHASSSSSTTNNNNRIIDEDPLRFGVAAAGPGPAAVAAANARARRNATNNDNNPPAGLNARRNRQRVQNAHNANNYNNGAGADPAPYYYRRVQPPPHVPAPAPARRAARAGRRQRDVYQGILRGAGGGGAAAGYDDGWEGEVQDEVYRYLGGNGGDDGGGDFDDFADIEFQPYLGVGRNNNNNNHAGRGALQGIMQLLGFGNHLMNNNNNALPINHQHVHFNHANPPKRKVKAYSVRQSHPNFNKKKDGKDGFERDIIPPPEIEDKQEEQEEQDQPEVEEAQKQKHLPEDKAQEPSQEAKEDSIMEIQPEESGSASTRSSSRNKGKGRALEIDTFATSTGQETNADIPILDLANGSPNTSASTASSALFSGKLSNSTRATSTDGHTDSDSAKQADIQTQITNAAPTQPIKPKTRTIRAPVCTSCSTPFFLNQSSKGRPYVLLCGHVICRGCLDAATERLRRFTMDEPEVIQDDEDEGGDIEIPSARMYEDDEDDGNSSLPPLPSRGTAWKGARLKESFEEVDRSRSSTIAETSAGRASTSKSAKDKKGKKKATSARSNATTSTSSASTSQAPAASSASTSTSARSSGRGTRRNATRPDYAELDGDEEGQPDGSYIPQSRRDGQDDDESDDGVSRNAGHQASTEEEDEERTLRSLIRKKPDNATASSARITKSKKGPTTDNQEDDGMLNVVEGAEDPDYVADRKGKGTIKIVMNGVSAKQEDAADGPSSSNANTATVTGKRKRGKEDNEAAAAASSGKSASTKAKKPKIEKPPLIDVHWLTCPVNGCKGGTDLSKAIGSREGAWELFV